MIRTRESDVSTYTRGMQTQMPSRTKQVGKCVSFHGKTFETSRNWSEWRMLKGFQIRTHACTHSSGPTKDVWMPNSALWPTIWPLT